ncbi:hypothetical protein VKT23_012284 [Stygiomarasmius scandens]|uniref:Helicase C-terminal domain-containing protein n=1 Tax=Marasmiellus scandens TaxID=2682957 RepID=A0ABR1J951_9AGAR
MSTDYLTDAHNEFTKPDGKCKILVATAGESMGIDHPDVEIVCLAGLPSDITSVLQRGGHAVRQILGDGLCVIFYDNWVNEIDLADYGLEDSLDINSFDFNSDIDRPPKNILTLKSTAKEHASLACILITRCLFCLRLFFAKCLGDTSPEALEFFTAFCCDAHDDGFDLQELLPGKLYNPSITPETSDVTKEKLTGPKSRSSTNKKQLRKLLEQWLEKAHLNNTMAPTWPVYYILSESHLKTLSSAPPYSIVISAFDAEKEKVLSPEIIEDSEWYESDWEELFEQEKETRTRMEGIARKVMGEKRFLDDLDSRALFFDSTNTL